MSMRSVAFLCGGIGDQLLHFSQLQAFTSLYSSKVDIYCQHPAIMKEIILGSEWAGSITDIKPFKKVINLQRYKDAVRELQQRDADVAVVFHPSTSFKIAAHFAKIPQRIGFSHSWADKLLLTEDLVQQGKETENEQLWGHRPFGGLFDRFLLQQEIDPVGTTPIKPLGFQRQFYEEMFAAYPRPHIITTIYSQDKSRCWPVLRASDCLSNVVKQHGGTIFLSSGDDAREMNAEFINHWPESLPAPVDVRRVTSEIKNELGLFHFADLFLGINSFTANLAMNCDLPSIILFHKRSYMLNYRKNSSGLYPVSGTEIADICDEDIREKIDVFLGPKKNKK